MKNKQNYFYFTFYGGNVSINGTEKSDKFWNHLAYRIVNKKIKFLQISRIYPSFFL